MNDKLDTYLNKPSELLFEWHDKETTAVGWLVINSLKNCAAGGGTRMRSGLSKEEVVSLAKVMELKFSVCGPPIGGAKSGINFDPSDPRKTEVLQRWFKAIKPFLKSYYGTGGDLNVDEVKDVFPITENLGIIHPQEGVLQGYFNYPDDKKQLILKQLDHGCKLPVKHPLYSVDIVGNFTVADMITGYGVAESVRHFYSIFKNSDLKGKTVLIQGWGNVASSAAFYLSQQGAIIKAIIDKDYGIYEENGMNLEEVRNLFLTKDGNKLSSSKMKKTEELENQIWNSKYDIFIPAAASRIVELSMVQKLIQHGLELISCGANVPFKENRIIYGDTSREIDSQIALIPDFIANSGMARTFAYLMKEGVTLDEKSIFEDVSELMKQSLLQIRGFTKESKNLMNNFLFVYLNN
ncbi:MAG: amino acid dehydrogenase [Saprospiraceae bacterium]|nr:amino acid dehydrogenase [Saprospiraceae bacterium]